MQNRTKHDKTRRQDNVKLVTQQSPMSNPSYQKNLPLDGCRAGGDDRAGRGEGFFEPQLVLGSLACYRQAVEIAS